MTVEIIQNWIMVGSIFITSATTCWVYWRSTRDNKKDFLDRQLIELQRLSFQFPFVEDENYTMCWNEFKEKYKNNSLSDTDKYNFLKYDVYTEMLFNFIEMCLKLYPKEKDLLNYIDFKSWVRMHAECWKNPLQAHSNREVYGKKMYDMIEDWLK